MAVLRHCFRFYLQNNFTQIASNFTITRAMSGKGMNLGSESFESVKECESPLLTSCAASDTNEMAAVPIRIVSYNVLAQVYSKSAAFPHCPRYLLKWKHRSKRLEEQILGLNADILCLQEVDEFESFYNPLLGRHGYGSVYLKRPGQKKDGSAIFFKNDRFELVAREDINYNDLVPAETEAPAAGSDSSAGSHGCHVSTSVDGQQKPAGDDRGDPDDPRVRLKRDNVGVAVALKSREVSDAVFVVACSHLFWNPKWAEVKLAQARHLLHCLHSFKSSLQKHHQFDIPVLIGGDFNSRPGDPVYNFLTLDGTIPTTVAESIGSSSLCNSNSSRMKLLSAYGKTGGEPLLTTDTPYFTDTIDYLFLHSSHGIVASRRLTLPTAGDPSLYGYLPNVYHPSDHLPIGVDLSLLFPLASCKINDKE